MQYNIEYYKKSINLAANSSNIDLDAFLLIGDLLTDFSFLDKQCTKEEKEACLVVANGLKLGIIYRENKETDIYKNYNVDDTYIPRKSEWTRKQLLLRLELFLPNSLKNHSLFIKYLDKIKFYKVPSQEQLKWARKMENIFVDIHRKEDLSKSFSVVYRLISDLIDRLSYYNNARKHKRFKAEGKDQNGRIISKPKKKKGLSM